MNLHGFTVLLTTEHGQTFRWGGSHTVGILDADGREVDCFEYGYDDEGCTFERLIALCAATEDAIA